MFKPQITGLIYSSRAGIPAKSIQEASMVLDAREKNAQLAITGYLMRGEAHFVQYIEGPGFAVDHLFGIIEADHRHRDVELEDRFTREDRLFHDWSMGFALPGWMMPFADGDPRDMAILSRLTAPNQPAPWNGGPRAALAYLYH